MVHFRKSLHNIDLAYLRSNHFFLTYADGSHLFFENPSNLSQVICWFIRIWSCGPVNVARSSARIAVSFGSPSASHAGRIDVFF